MPIQLSPQDYRDLSKYGSIAIASIITYVVLWRRQRFLAVFILVCLAGYVSSEVLDWNYWKTYFFVDWGRNGIAGTAK